MEITFWGVRGSIPSPGSEFSRYGGNTPCVAIRTRSNQLIILDAGTGIIALGRDLLQTEFGQGKGKATLLLTHGHWDHIQGFPFFAPVFIEGNQFDIFGPSDSPSMVEGILEGQMNPHFSPVHSLRNLGATIECKATYEGEPLPVPGLSISSLVVPHGRTTALAYRLSEGTSSIVYVPDVGYSGGQIEERERAFYAQATYLIHDCNYTPEDQQARLSRGHSSIDEVARIAAAAQVKALVMFHYDQDYSDEQVDILAQRCRCALDEQTPGQQVMLLAAREKMTVSC